MLRDIALPLAGDAAMHALIIEDEPLIALSIEGILRECGFDAFDIASTI